MSVTFFATKMKLAGGAAPARPMVTRKCFCSSFASLYASENSAWFFFHSWSVSGFTPIFRANRANVGMSLGTNRYFSEVFFTLPSAKYSFDFSDTSLRYGSTLKKETSSAQYLGSYLLGRPPGCLGISSLLGFPRDLEAHHLPLRSIEVRLSPFLVNEAVIRLDVSFLADSFRDRASLYILADDEDLLGVAHLKTILEAIQMMGIQRNLGIHRGLGRREALRIPNAVACVCRARSNFRDIPSA